jgi:DNA helicase-2/ATP-dependent DNA helicase PcrA
MSNAALSNSNASLDDHVEDEIASCLSLEKPNSFFLFAGAGSGKTRSLVTGLAHLKRNYGTKLRLRGQRIAVITYTNAAVDEIVRRIEFDSLFHVSTIHSFAWQLISGFDRDIREWVRKSLATEITELTELEAKGRAGTKASIARLAQIESKRERLAALNQIKSFTYNPNGDNHETNSLSHSEVISISSSFLDTKPLMQKILVQQYPFLLVDEGQDTNRKFIDALMTIEASYRDRFCLGFFGDTMQRIYNEGKEKFEGELPVEWKKPVKRLNFRCPKRIVRLLNRIRKDADGQQQEAITTNIEGYVRLFVFAVASDNKASIEEAVRDRMAKVADDDEWRNRDHCKILTLEHHMAAKRMAFQGVFDPLYAVDEFRTGLLDGTLPALRLFVKEVLPLVDAEQRKDKFAAAKVVREMSPLLSESVLRKLPHQAEQLRMASNAVRELMSLWKKDEPSCGEVLRCIVQTGLFAIPESLQTIVAIDDAKPESNFHEDGDGTNALPGRVKALESFLQASFSEIASYAQYLSEAAPFDTHQGVKGREFDRVMVLMDDAEARGFMFNYEKLFGVEAQSASDEKNIREGKETSLDRTRRLFYVTCSRARKSLAIVAYSSNPEIIRRNMIANGWFEKDEIIVALALP